MIKFRKLLIAFLCLSIAMANAGNSIQQYQDTVNFSRLKIQTLLTQLQKQRQQTPDQQIAYIAAALADIPYLDTGAQGEGDWNPAARTYQPGFVHIKQDPVYRLDGMDCQTFVQVAIALLHSADLAQFDKNFIKISYGAAGQTADGSVHYYNRNNFVDGDWNPLNEKNGFLKDVTSSLPDAKQTSAIITRQQWFLRQQKNPGTNVRVLSEDNRAAMNRRFMTVYSNLNFPHFKSEKVTISYIPKTTIALLKPDGSYEANTAILEKIPTPAVVEIIRDTRKWYLHGKIIRAAISTELNISHLGLLYRKIFKKGEIIYQKISCGDNHSQNCQVSAVTCEKNTCPELMFAHATDAHPDSYFWYQTEKGHYTCSPRLPTDQTAYTRCNRVSALPLFDYLTDYQQGNYRYMHSPSILGVHVEQLN